MVVEFQSCLLHHYHHRASCRFGRHCAVPVSHHYNFERPGPHGSHHVYGRGHSETASGVTFGQRAAGLRPATDYRGVRGRRNAFQAGADDCACHDLGMVPMAMGLGEAASRTRRWAGPSSAVDPARPSATLFFVPGVFSRCTRNYQIIRRRKSDTYPASVGDCIDEVRLEITIVAPHNEAGLPCHFIGGRCRCCSWLQPICLRC